MKAAEIMTPNVIVAGPDSRVHDIAWLMTEHHVSAIPIVRHGTLVGIVSESDLLHRVELGTADAQRGLLEFFTSSRKRARDYVKTHSRRARDVMTSAVVVVNTETPLEDVVRTLAERGLKRVPVLDAGGAVVGIISRANLVRALAVTPPECTSADDTAIRIALLDEYDRQGWAHVPPGNVIVEDGVVHLWGRIQSPEIRQAMQVAAENIPGVKAVENHLDEGDFGGDPFDRPQWPVSTAA
jgi:CBS domain-containing protein